MTDGLIYDADCGFCTRSARWLSQGRDWTPIPWQGLADLTAATESCPETAT